MIEAPARRNRAGAIDKNYIPGRHASPEVAECLYESPRVRAPIEVTSGARPACRALPKVHPRYAQSSGLDRDLAENLEPLFLIGFPHLDPARLKGFRTYPYRLARRKRVEPSAGRKCGRAARPHHRSYLRISAIKVASAAVGHVVYSVCARGNANRAPWPTSRACETDGMRTHAVRVLNKPVVRLWQRIRYE